MEELTLDEQLKCQGRQVMMSNHTIEAVQKQASQSDKEFLLEVFSKELKFRWDNKRKRLRKKASFPAIKSFDNYDWSHVSIPETISKNDIVTCDFIRESKNLVLFGPVETGKTHMCIALGMSACELGLKVRYFTTTELVLRLSKAKEEGTVEKLLKELKGYDMLILDEFGYVPVDRDGARLLFQVISAAYERQSLVITTNVDFSRWGSVLMDDQLAAAIIDRVAHHGILLVFEGESYRLKHALMRS